MKKRWSLLLALLLLLQAVPTVFADDNGGGNETTPEDFAEPTILWDFNADNAMSTVMAGAEAVSYSGINVDGVDCYQFTAGGNDPFVTVNMSADDVSEIVWAKARVKNPSTATAVELFGATNGRGLGGPECTHIDIKSEDDNWYTYLINIPYENVRTVNTYKTSEEAILSCYWEGHVDSIRLDPLWREGDDGSDSAGNMKGGEFLYIDYIAFFPTKEDALAFRADDDNYAFQEQTTVSEESLRYPSSDQSRTWGELIFADVFGSEDGVARAFDAVGSTVYTTDSVGVMTDYYTPYHITEVRILPTAETTGLLVQGSYDMENDWETVLDLSDATLAANTWFVADRDNEAYRTDSTGGAYPYFRLIQPSGKTVDIAEVEFYGDRMGDGIVYLRDVPHDNIGEAANIEQAFDGDWETYATLESDNTIGQSIANHGQTSILTQIYMYLREGASETAPVSVRVEAKNAGEDWTEIGFMEITEGDSIHFVFDDSTTYTEYRIVNTSETALDIAELEFWCCVTAVNDTTYTGNYPMSSGDHSKLLPVKTTFGYESWDNYRRFGRAFDGNADTFYDADGAGNWNRQFVGIAVEDNEKAILEEVRILPRQYNAEEDGENNFSRLNGMVVQGSNDGYIWDDLWAMPANTEYADDTWYTLTSDNQVNYERENLVPQRTQWEYIKVPTLDEAPAGWTTGTDTSENWLTGSAPFADHDVTGGETPGLAIGNYCYGANVTVSGVEEGNHEVGGSYAVDGDMSTRWASEHEDDTFITLDMEMPRDIGYVEIYWEAASARDYVVELSLDGVNWNTVVDVVNNNDCTDDPEKYVESKDVSFEFPVTKARYLRIVTSRRNTKWGNSIWEIVARESKNEVNGSTDWSGAQNTIFLRRTFNVENAETYPALYANITYDNGITMYLNGHEIYRDAGASDGYIDLNLTGAAQYLVDGDNILAVSLCNTEGERHFDMSLSADVGTRAYAYYRLVNNDEWLNVAELEFYGTLTGKYATSDYPTAGYPASPDDDNHYALLEGDITSGEKYIDPNEEEYPTFAMTSNNGGAYANLEDAKNSIGAQEINTYEPVGGTGSYENEEPWLLWDGNTSSKFCTNEFPAVSVTSLGGLYTIDGILMATANDTAEFGRLPTKWAIYGSVDGESWTPLAHGDDTFFKETNETFYAASLVSDGTAYRYVKFQATDVTGTDTFQLSEVVLCGDKVADVENRAWEPAVDGDVDTFYDAASYNQYIMLDVTADEYARLDEVRIYPRQGNCHRIVGLTVQGSNDGENWEDVICVMGDTQFQMEKWYTFTPNTENGGKWYRFYRLTNVRDHLNVAEVEFYGETSGSPDGGETDGGTVDSEFGNYSWEYYYENINGFEGYYIRNFYANDGFEESLTADGVNDIYFPYEIDGLPVIGVERNACDALFEYEQEFRVILTSVYTLDIAEVRERLNEHGISLDYRDYEVVNGVEYFYAWELASVVGYNEDALDKNGALVIPETVPYTMDGSGDIHTVVTVGYEALTPYANDDVSVTSIKLPETVTHIARNAIIDQQKMTVLTLPAGLEFVDEHGIKWNYALKEIKGLNDIDVDSNARFRLYSYRDEHGTGQGIVDLGMSSFFSYTAGSPTQTYVVDHPKILQIRGDSFREADNLCNLTIDEGIESTQSWTFSFCDNLSYLYLPSTLNSIDNALVQGVYTLSDIDLNPENETFVEKEDGAIYRKIWDDDGKEIGLALAIVPYGITEYDIPQNIGVIELHEAVLEHNDNLTEINVPEGVTEIRCWTLDSNKNLKKVTLPDSLRVINSYAFANDKEEDMSLYDITIPEGVEEIGQWAFEDMVDAYTPYSFTMFFTGENPPEIVDVEQNADLSNNDHLLIVVPDEYLNAYREAFVGKLVPEDANVISLSEYNTKITNNNLADFGLLVDKTGCLYEYNGTRARLDLTDCTVITSIGNGVFRDSSVVEVKLPATVTYIGDEAFANCAAVDDEFMDSLVNVTEIGDRAFRDTWNITTLNVPPKITNINNGMFKAMSSVETLNIHKDVVGIAEGVFEHMESLKKITVAEGNTRFKTDAQDALYELGEDNAPVRLIATPTNNGAKGFTIPNTVNAIDAFALYSYETLEGTLTIPASVEHIGDYALSYLRGIQAFDVADGCKNYFDEDGVLYRREWHEDEDGNCLTLLNYPIGSKDTSYTVRDNTKYIKDDAFNNAVLLESVTMPDTVEEIRSFAFEGTTALREVKLSANLKYLGDWAFSGSGIETIDLPNTLTEVDGGAFANSHLTEIVIPAGVTEIRNDTFVRCRDLVSVTLPNVSCIREWAFEDCPSLTSIYFATTEAPDIHPDAFYDTNTDNVTLYCLATNKWSNVDWTSGDTGILTYNFTNEDGEVFKTSTFTVKTYTTEVVDVDFDNNGSIDINDAKYIADHADELDSSYDFDHDGDVDADDANYLFKYSILPELYPIH